MHKDYVYALYYVGDNTKKSFSVDILIPSEGNNGRIGSRLVQDLCSYKYLSNTLFRIVSISECNI